MKTEIARKIVLRGTRPIMFDRYAGDNKTKLPPEEKFYFDGDGKSLIMPAINLLSFLGAQNNDSASKLVYGKAYKAIAKACYGFVNIEPFEIPLLREGKPIVFKGFDKTKGVYADDKYVPRVKGGIPQPTSRPVVELPWELEFTITLLPNEEGLNESALRTLFDRGGLAIGLGTFRGAFGKFVIDKWE